MSQQENEFYFTRNVTAWIRLRAACVTRLLALLLLLLALPAVVQAQYNTTTNNGTITITKYTGSAFAVDIPSTINGLPVTSIGNGAFSGCTSLTSITIPNSVISIGQVAFSSCTSLTSIAIPNSVTSIGSQAFFYCTSLTSVTIPDSVTSINDNAFYSCKSLASVTIGNSVTNVAEWAFAYCTSLSAITVNAQNSVYSSVDGVLFNKSQTTLIQCPKGKNGIYTIPNSVTSIGLWAFFDCPSLISVTIPNSVTGVGDFAFTGCSNLTSIAIPNSVTSIGGSAFADCASLTSVTIPNSVTSIGAMAFYRCTSLAVLAVDVLNSVYSSVDGVLFNKSQTTLIQYPAGKAGIYTIPNRVINIESNAFSFCTSLTSVTIPDAVIFMGNKAFDSCKSLANITIGNSVTNIGDYTFQGCTSLTSITIPNSVISIGGGAFAVCTNLTSITIPNSVTSIGSNAFYRCTRLSSVTIPTSVTNIGYGAFGYCTSLTSVTIPTSVTSIGLRAFSDCSNLISVTIGNSVKSIGIGAFSGCTSLAGIYFQGNAPSVGLYTFDGANKAIVYYLAGTTGWGPTFGGRPTALWVPLQVQISAGANGSISPNTTQMAIRGESVSFTANPNAGYLVDQWLVDGAVVQTGGNSYTLPNIQANRSVHVTFTYDPMIPTPVITALQPYQVKPGGPLFILNVNGFNFMAGSVIRWNGTNQTTTFGSSNSLMAIVMNTLIASPGTVSITVVNPGPNGGVRSAELLLTIAETPTTPKITLGRTNNTIIIGWPSEAIGFKLQSSSVLPATNWQDVAGSEATDSWSVTIGTGKQFYRLKK